MRFKEHAAGIGPDGTYRYRRSPVVTAIVPPTTEIPLHTYISPQLAKALRRSGDEVIMVSPNPKDEIPERVSAAVRLDDASSERPPRELLRRFPSGKRSEKKAVYAIADPKFPQDAELTSWARGYLGRKAATNVVVFEANPTDTVIREHTRVAVGSMEGNVGVETLDSRPPSELFNRVGGRLAFLSSCEPVNKREGVLEERVTFDGWVQRPEVQGMRQASHILAASGLFWDIDLGKYAGIVQQVRILSTLRQAGLGEGMMSTLVDVAGNTVMAVTETGTKKTDSDPKKGNAVPVAGFTEHGTVHWILQGWPKGHLVNVLRHPTRESVRDAVELLFTSFLRGQLGMYVRDLRAGRPMRVDRPPSIEGHENALFYCLSALRQAGIVTTFEEGLRYLAEKFETARVLPIIPDGVGPAANAAIHIHKSPARDQEDKSVKIVDADMEGFSFPHSPGCGTREAAFLVVKAIFDSHDIYGPPLSKDEIRGVGIPGHGSLLWGYSGIVNLTQGVAKRVVFDPYVARF